MFTAYKPGQGKISRTLTVLAGVFFALWAARSMALHLPDIWGKLGLAWNELLADARPSDAWTVDLVVLDTMKVSPALTLAAAVALGGSVWWLWLCNRPSVADRLVDMETELHKVSWPSFPDAWQSTLVVSGFTALVVVLVLVYDIVIKGMIKLMPVASGS